MFIPADVAAKAEEVYRKISESTDPTNVIAEALLEERGDRPPIGWQSRTRSWDWTNGTWGPPSDWTDWTRPERLELVDGKTLREYRAIYDTPEGDYVTRESALAAIDHIANDHPGRRETAVGLLKRI